MPWLYPLGQSASVYGDGIRRTASSLGRLCSKYAMRDNERRTDIALALLATASIAGIVLIGRTA